MKQIVAVRNCVHKVAQIVIQSRVQEAQTKGRNADFRLDLPELPGLRDKIDEFTKNRHSRINIEINVTPKNDNPILLERWSIEYERDSTHHSPRAKLGRKNHMQDCEILVRSVFSYLRILPASYLCRKPEQGLADQKKSYSIGYCISTTSELTPFDKSPASMDFFPIQSPDGERLQVCVYYRQNCSFLFAKRKRNHMNPGDLKIKSEHFVPEAPSAKPPPPPGLPPNYKNLPPNYKKSEIHVDIEEEEGGKGRVEVVREVRAITDRDSVSSTSTISQQGGVIIPKPNTPTKPSPNSPLPDSQPEPQAQVQAQAQAEIQTLSELKAETPYVRRPKSLPQPQKVVGFEVSSTSPALMRVFPQKTEKTISLPGYRDQQTRVSRAPSAPQTISPFIHGRFRNLSFDSSLPTPLFPLSCHTTPPRSPSEVPTAPANARSHANASANNSDTTGITANGKKRNPSMSPPSSQRDIQGTTTYGGYSSTSNISHTYSYTPTLINQQGQEGERSGSSRPDFKSNRKACSVPTSDSGLLHHRFQGPLSGPRYTPGSSQVNAKPNPGGGATYGGAVGVNKKHLSGFAQTNNFPFAGSSNESSPNFRPSYLGPLNHATNISPTTETKRQGFGFGLGNRSRSASIVFPDDDGVPIELRISPFKQSDAVRSSTNSNHNSNALMGTNRRSNSTTSYDISLSNRPPPSIGVANNPYTTSHTSILVGTPPSIKNMHLTQHPPLQATEYTPSAGLFGDQTDDPEAVLGAFIESLESAPKLKLDKDTTGLAGLMQKLNRIEKLIAS
uniref:Autophagy-related protein 13 N-terminal domain-containing protein n=1 Tax=Amorphochlora amoebiformis TaxID=1561963 RepID=A0A7S0DNK6_9EUKA|mmetsp:Transcript_3722/g.5743  ORF Transcript_3722/g.5743 Transcript_3722/m.5743 type:complete len:786 (+) Transcript_3722:96-2453(+)